MRSTILDEPMTDARYGLNLERARGKVLREMTQYEDAPVERIVGDDPAVPARLREHFAGDHLRARLRKGNQDLHDSRL
jgi:hypothetical protein